MRASIWVAAVGAALLAGHAHAHRSGCHRWHSCPSDHGTYVCGDTGHFSECGYSSLPKEKKPRETTPARPRAAEPPAPYGTGRERPATAPAGAR